MASSENRWSFNDVLYLGTVPDERINSTRSLNTDLRRVQQQSSRVQSYLGSFWTSPLLTKLPFGRKRVKIPQYLYLSK